MKTGEADGTTRDEMIEDAQNVLLLHISDCENN